MSEPDWYDWVEAAAGKRPQSHRPMGGGSIAAVYRLDMGDSGDLVIKIGGADSGFPLEAAMLKYLAEHSDLPVPAVVASDDRHLLMSHIPAGGRLDPRAEAHAADLLAALHNAGADSYGFDWDTVIGGIPQPNPWAADWADFFRDSRVLYMADLCVEAGEIDGRDRKRFDRLGDKLPDLIPTANPPGLVHGDMWGGNVLVADGCVAGFIDPAIYYADPEIELAFSTLFGTFGEAFFARYREHRPLSPDFFEVRRDLYNLWHLLNHVYLFGRGYWSGVDRTLSRFGC